MAHRLLICNKSWKVVQMEKIMDIGCSYVISSPLLVEHRLTMVSLYDLFCFVHDKRDYKDMMR